MCGLPRSGKTTRAKQLTGYVRISPDDIRQALYNGAYMPRAEAHVWAMAETMTRAFLIADCPVVVDATFISREHRRRWADLGAEFGLTLTIYFVDTGYVTCVTRNHGAGAVPMTVIDRMLEHFERPTAEEGNLFTISKRAAPIITELSFASSQSANSPTSPPSS